MLFPFLSPDTSTIHDQEILAERELLDKCLLRTAQDREPLVGNFFVTKKFWLGNNSSL